MDKYTIMHHFARWYNWAFGSRISLHSYHLVTSRTLPWQTFLPGIKTMLRIIPLCFSRKREVDTFIKECIDTKSLDSLKRSVVFTDLYAPSIEGLNEWFDQEGYKMYGGPDQEILMTYGLFETLALVEIGYGLATDETIKALNDASPLDLLVAHTYLQDFDKIKEKYPTFEMIKPEFLRYTTKGFVGKDYRSFVTHILGERRIKHKKPSYEEIEQLVKKMANKHL